MSHYFKFSIILFLCFQAAVFAETFESYPKRPIQTVGELTLPHVFSDHMVLQRNQSVRIWGWAKSNAQVKVEFAGQSKTTKADAHGSWNLSLDAMKASFESRKFRVLSEGKVIELKDVLVGEVWLMGGQSNMEFKLVNSVEGDMEVNSANLSSLRYLRLPLISKQSPQADYPLEEGKGRWNLGNGDMIGDCSAVGYYFGLRLHRFLKVPVGLIDTSWGGTMAQHWAGSDMLKGIPEMKSYFDNLDKINQAWIDGGKEAGAKRDHEKAMAEYNKMISKLVLKEGQRKPGPPKMRQVPTAREIPGGMTNAMIAPISGYTIKAVLFYQGENNSFSESWKPYAKTLPAVIATHRKAFQNPDLPFGIIQIAGWSTRRAMSYDQNHHCNVIREVQFDTWQKTPNTGLIVTFDLNTTGSIHPNRKRPIGERSARWALAEVYKEKSRGRDIEWMGPVYERYEVKGDKIIIYFDPKTARSLRINKGVDVGFYIAGEDKKFHFAKAKADNRRSTVTVWKDGVKNPVAVRYAISNLPIGGLMNSRQIPAFPFRTDNWPIKPHQSTGEYVRQ